jgi:AcrR family transcriptional regulator
MAAASTRRVSKNEPGPHPRPVRSRRSPQEVERLILDAARDLFASRGYAGSTTREIAALAGVSEPLLYRRYGSKAGLFRAAVMVPFGEVITSYLDAWQAQIDRPVSLRELVVAFIDPLYGLLREHSELAMALVQGRDLNADTGSSDGTESNDGDGGWPSELGEVLQRLVPQLEIEAARRNLRVDASTTNVVVLGMVLGLALLDPVLPTDAVHTTPAQISSAMVELILHGVSPESEALSSVAVQRLPPDAPVTATVLLELHDRVVEAERRATRAEQALAQCAERLSARSSKQ